MYAAKQGGRGRWQLFDTSLREASARRLEMISALHRAVEQDEIEMLLQPIVDLGDGRLAGVEALLRWRRAGQLVPPLEFVPLAEEAGLIAEIERFALAEACRLGQRLAALHGEPIAVSVNVSPRHALQGDLAASVGHALATTGFDPGNLLVELTESERIEDIDGLADVLGAVRALGVSVALDDFGTGWSTLGLLRRVPFDALKIDRSFTGGPAGEPQRSRARRGDRHARAQPRRAGRRRGHRAARAVRVAARDRLRSRAGLPVRAAEHGRAARRVARAAGRGRRARRHSSAQSCLTFAQSASAGSRLGGRKREPGKARAGGVNAPRSTSRRMLPR